MQHEAIEVDKILQPFKALDQLGNEYQIPVMNGKKTLLSFHPLAWTGICTQQMEKLDELYDKFAALGVQPFGVSVDAAPTKKAWGESMKLEHLPLLVDFWPHGEIADKMSIFIGDRGTSGRGNILVDQNGKVFWTKVNRLSELPDFDEILDFLKK